MFDILKAVRETAATRAGAVPSRKPTKPRPELTRLWFEVERTQCTTDVARNHFERAMGPTLTGYYICELNAAQLWYQFSLRRFRSQED